MKGGDDMTEREQLANDMLQEIAKDISRKLPPEMGFCLLAYETGDEDGRRMLYVSNSNRDDVAKAMLEWVEKVRKENYGKDVK